MYVLVYVRCAILVYTCVAWYAIVLLSRYACLHVLFSAWVGFFALVDWYIAIASSCIGSTTVSSSGIATLPIFWQQVCQCFGGSPFSSIMPSCLSMALPVHSSPQVLLQAGSVIASLPPKLVKKILDLDYVDMVSWFQIHGGFRMILIRQNVAISQRGWGGGLLQTSYCRLTVNATMVALLSSKGNRIFVIYAYYIKRTEVPGVSYDMAYRRRVAN